MCEAGQSHKPGARLARRRRGLSPCPGQQKLSAGLHPESSRVRARRGEEKDRERELPTAGVRELLGAGAGFLSARENRSRARARTRNQPRACAVGQRNKPGARFAHRRCACVRGWVQTQTRYANCPAQPRVSFRPQGTGAGLSLCLGKQKLSAGAHSETAAGVRGWAQTQTRCATCSAQPRRRKSSAKLCGKRLDNSDKLYYNK